MPGKNYQMDMCRGPLFRQMILFGLPLMATSILNLTFNAVDMIVVGHFASYKSLAAVGSCGNIFALMINTFSAISVGANVLVSRAIGGKNEQDVQKYVHTSMALALYCGIGMGILAQILAGPALRITGTPAEIMDEALAYLRIICLGIPFLLIYNFGCAILRSVGDTRRPLYFLMIAGVVNVVLNLFFVICCGMTAAGVGLATLISQGLSVFLLIRVLLKAKGSYALRWNLLRINWKQCREVLKIGIPAGVQSSAFSISNVTIQSAINSFGAFAVAGSTATLMLESIVYTGSGTFHMTALSFVAQNYGGKQYNRIKKIFFMSAFLGSISTFCCGNGMALLGKPLLMLFTTEPQAIEWGLQRMQLIFATYILCGLMDATSGCLRGLGYSMTSTIICVVGVCALRLFWVLAIFPMHRTFPMLLACYPITWGMAALLTILMLWWLWKNKIGPMRKLYNTVPTAAQ